MEPLKLSLENLDKVFPDDFTQEQTARAKTLFLKKLAEISHRFYHGKIQTLPKAPVPGFNWFNIWYTPGVSMISTTIRDDNEQSFELTNRSNLVAVVSDSTRVLGDGNCTPPGGMGVMEGKAFLMKYLGGVDAVALCIDSRNEEGACDCNKIIDFVKMAQYSFGAVNLEDISQPNCYRVLDTLREECVIPVWHDDAQGTACVILGGLINALKLAGKRMGNAKIVFYGAGAANTTVARLAIADGADPDKIIMFDVNGSLHEGRDDLRTDARFYRAWELCQITNKSRIMDIETAMDQADVLIALSAPGPDIIKPDWIRRMADKSIVFTCANPVPEIYPYAAREAGAFIVATGRGDFPNQVNNSLGFPGILKGAMTVHASKITDNMAIAAAHSLANFAEKRGINTEDIIPRMDEEGVFAEEAADVAMQAIKDGVAHMTMSRDKILAIATEDIRNARETTHKLTELGLIKPPDIKMLQEAMDWAVGQVRR
jgi:malate dehydrogenase (oxaloacetate-decarboxylating)